jgi:CRP/FNR family transcriptional regulator, cyclic AMP receptor protein
VTADGTKAPLGAVEGSIEEPPCAPRLVADLVHRRLGGLPSTVAALLSTGCLDSGATGQPGRHAVVVKEVAGRGPAEIALRSSPLLGRLNHDDLTALFKVGRPMKQRRGDLLLRPEDDMAAVLLTGVAIAAVIGRDGEPMMIDLLGPGTVAGLPVVLGRPEAGVQVTALTPVEYLRFLGSPFRDHIATRPHLTVACLRAVTAELATARGDLARHSDTSTTERVIDRLLQLADDWGEPVDGEVRITVPLTQEMLASWARSSRESTAKVLHELRNQGLIRTGRRELAILDLERLDARVGGPGPAAERMIRDLSG